jgi:hypothetical protein
MVKPANAHAGTGGSAPVHPVQKNPASWKEVRGAYTSPPPRNVLGCPDSFQYGVIP